MTLKLIYHLISSQSLNLGGRRDTTDEVSTIPFHPSLSSAALRESPHPIPVRSLVLSSHLFFCLPLLAPFTVPCRTVFAMPEDLEMLVSVSLPWSGDHHALQLHSGFCFEPPRSSGGLCRKCSEVSYSIPSQGLGFFSRFLLSRSSSHGHKGRWIRWASAYLEVSEMFLSLHMIFSLERAAVVWAILDRISGFDPSLEMIAPRYLKLSTSSSLWPFILISLKPFRLFVITFVLSSRKRTFSRGIVFNEQNACNPGRRMVDLGRGCFSRPSISKDLNIVRSNLLKTSA